MPINIWQYGTCSIFHSPRPILISLLLYHQRQRKREIESGGEGRSKGGKNWDQIFHSCVWGSLVWPSRESSICKLWTSIIHGSKNTRSVTVSRGSLSREQLICMSAHIFTIFPPSGKTIHGWFWGRASLTYSIFSEYEKYVFASKPYPPTDRTIQ